MPVRTACASCGQKLNVRDELLDKRAKCPVCGHVFVATAQDTTTSPSTEPNAAKELLKPSAKQRGEHFGGGEDAPEPAPQTVGSFEILEPLGRGKPAERAVVTWTWRCGGRSRQGRLAATRSLRSGARSPYFRPTNR
jgi:predicted RNA-binding Zn-ribbon protein involved in translation (DUF1610 family)